MENRNLEIYSVEDSEFYSEFEKYDRINLPGVRLPQIKIEKKYYDDLSISSDCSNAEFLKTFCFRSLENKKLDKDQKYVSRLEMELSIFDELGFTDYILLNWEILNFCYESGIPTGSGRGSAAGSLTLFLLGVTKVDPIKYGLIFERFVSKARAKKTVIDGVTYLDGGLLPDVDSDISYDRRKEVIDFIEKKHSGKTCKILTINTLSGKLCVKECSKLILNYSETEANEVSDCIPKLFGKVFKLNKAYKEDSKFKKWADNNKNAFVIAQKIEGLGKNCGCHPSGISISFYPVYDICPLQKTSDGDLISGYDMNNVAEVMVKFDILGLRTLTLVDLVCKNLNISLDDIDPESPEIYNYFQDFKNAHGLFQIEADTNFKVCRKVAPKNLDQLSAVVAIARPGALEYIDDYLDKDNERMAELKTLSPKLCEILSVTQGVPLYQEQAMQIANEVFGFSLTDSESIRKCVGKKLVDQMKSWKEKIYENAKKESLDVKVADFFWKLLEDSANYSFNKCIFELETVQTPEGVKRLKDIKVGDMVKSFDIKKSIDHFVKVKNVYKNTKMLYKVKLECGKSITTSLDHKFLTGSGKMVPLKDIIANKMTIITE